MKNQGLDTQEKQAKRISAIKDKIYELEYNKYQIEGGLSLQSFLPYIISPIVIGIIGILITLYITKY